MTLENWQTDYEKARQANPKYYAMLDKLDAMEKEYKQAVADNNQAKISELAKKLGIVPKEESKTETVTWSSLIAEQQEQDDQDRYDLRLERCGVWASYLNVMTGKIEPFQYHCNLYDSCANCRDRRAHEEMHRLMEMDTDNLFVYTMTEKDWIYNTRRIDNTEYRRFKQTNGDIIVISDNPELRCTSVERGIDHDKFENILEFKDRDSKITGKLGREETITDEKDLLEGAPVMDVIAISTPASAETQREAYRLTIKDLLDKPEKPSLETDEDVQTFLTNISDTFKQYLNMLGAEIKYEFKLRRRIQKSLIDFNRIYMQICMEPFSQQYVDGLNGGAKQYFDTYPEASIPEFM